MVSAFVPLFANPQGVAQSPLQSTYIWHRLYQIASPNFGGELYFKPIKNGEVKTFSFSGIIEGKRWKRSL